MSQDPPGGAGEYLWGKGCVSLPDLLPLQLNLVEVEDMGWIHGGTFIKAYCTKKLLKSRIILI